MYSAIFQKTGTVSVTVGYGDVCRCLSNDQVAQCRLLMAANAYKFSFLLSFLSAA